MDNLRDIYAKSDSVDQEKNSLSSMKPDSPCIGFCSTSLGDTTCKGCGRGFMEVIEWIVYSEEQKAEIWARVEAEGTAMRFRPKSSLPRP